MARQSNKRQLKVPSRFNNYVVENLGKNQGETRSNKNSVETHVNLGDIEIQVDINSGVQDSGVFGKEGNTGDSTSRPIVSDNIVNNSTPVNVVNDNDSENVVNDNTSENAVNDNTPVNAVNDNKSENAVNDTLHGDNSNNESDKDKSTPKLSYANIVNNNGVKNENKLEFKPTVLNEAGEEFVIFDEDLVVKGSLKWKLTVCGHFVGCHMFVGELNYHLRRMWSKYGLLDVQVNGNGKCFFKFRNEEGMNEVLRQGPWIVNHRPLFVQKWDPIIGMEIKEKTKIPIWAKLTNVPLEAWSCDGMSALASSLGTPIIMDNTTTQMCKSGVGRAEFARVLVEFDAKNGFKDKIHIQYRNKENEVRGSKVVNVEYMWKPEVCSYCEVFGHNFQTCCKRPKTETELKDEKRKLEAVTKDKEGFIDDQNKGQGKSNGGVRYNGTSNVANNGMGRNGGVWKKKGGENLKQGNNRGDNNGAKVGQHKNGKTWPVTQNVVEDLRRSANKYVVLGNTSIEDRNEVANLNDRMIVDQYLNKKLQPSDQNLKDWTPDMAAYFKEKWDEDRRKEADAHNANSEEVMENVNATAQVWTDNVIKDGISTALN